MNGVTHPEAKIKPEWFKSLEIDPALQTVFYYLRRVCLDEPDKPVPVTISRSTQELLDQFQFAEI